MRRISTAFLVILLCMWGGVFRTAWGLEVSGKVFVDANGNGAYEPGEKVLKGVVVSDGSGVVVTGEDGSYSLITQPAAIVFVSVPGDYHAPENKFFGRLEGYSSPVILDFPLVKNRRTKGAKQFTLIFATDTHVGFLHHSREGTAKAYASIMSLKPDLVIHGGDIIMDGLKTADEGFVEREYQQYVNELEPLIKAPFYHTIGNHDVFGWVALPDPHPVPPLYGKEMYKKYIGPLYYSFNFKHCHFVVLDSIALGRPLKKEISYYGYIDEPQLAWLQKDLRHVDKKTPLVLVTHIPTINALSSLYGLNSEIAATPGGDVILKHQVSNFSQLFGDVLKGYNFKLALAGHYHSFEEVHWKTNDQDTMFVVGGSICGEWWKGDHYVGSVSWPEGFTVVEVDGENFDATYKPYGWKGEEEN